MGKFFLWTKIFMGAEFSKILKREICKIGSDSRATGIERYQTVS